VEIVSKGRLESIDHRPPPVAHRSFLRQDYQHPGKAEDKETHPVIGSREHGNACVSDKHLTSSDVKVDGFKLDP
jgi:hypothetical protein